MIRQMARSMCTLASRTKKKIFMSFMNPSVFKVEDVLLCYGLGGVIVG